MTTPTPHALKPRPKAITRSTVLQCPTCARRHPPDPQFGPFCCASCLQTPIRPLIAAVRPA
jgi:hypothetical protein